MALTEIPNPRIPARVLEVRTGSDADYVDQPGKPGGDSVLIAIRDVDLPDSRVATTRVDRLELIAALGVVRQPLLFSSGAHQFLNTQPWAVIEKSDEDGSETVDARFATMEEADEYVEAEAGGASYLYVQYAPNGIDNVPLTNPGNPILADIRAGSVRTWKLNRAGYWEHQILEIDEVDRKPFQRHALRVIQKGLAALATL